MVMMRAVTVQDVLGEFEFGGQVHGETVVHIMMNEVRDEEDERMQVPPPALLGPSHQAAGLIAPRQDQVWVPPTQGEVVPMDSGVGGGPGVQQHLQALTQFVGSHAVQFQSDLQLLHGAVNLHDQHLRDLDGMRTALATSSANTQDRWSSLEAWASRLQQTIAGLAQERSIFCGLLHTTQQQSEALFSHMNNLSTALLHTQEVVNGMYITQEDQ